uniref:MO25-like protein n=2 Tax=Leersia perrieri TaxID=77586 RepID=A0A0D9X0W2_9ORYZ
MKGLFKSKPRTPADVVRQTRELLIFLDLHSGSRGGDAKREEKMAELSKNIRELKSILYGNGESEPVTEACVQLTQEFFRENTLRLLIICLPKLNLETRKDATQVVANLQRQQVSSKIVASEYLEANKDLLDTLISGYENMDIALHYGSMLRECIRHQSIARYVLESEHMKKFFHYIQLPNFDIASDASATFKELLTRHKATVAEFLSKNYDWFFSEFNSRLLSSTNYITKRQAIKLLGDMLLDRSNSAVMMRYVSSKDNLMILMNLLRDSSKNIQIEAFHVFKLFAANKNKPTEVVNILVTNRSKLLRFFAGFKIDKEDEQFEADKEQHMKSDCGGSTVLHMAGSSTIRTGSMGMESNLLMSPLMPWQRQMSALPPTSDLNPSQQAPGGVGVAVALSTHGNSSTKDVRHSVGGGGGRVSGEGSGGNGGNGGNGGKAGSGGSDGRAGIGGNGGRAGKSGAAGVEVVAASCASWSPEMAGCCSDGCWLAAAVGLSSCTFVAADSCRVAPGMANVRSMTMNHMRRAISLRAVETEIKVYRDTKECYITMSR